MTRRRWIGEINRRLGVIMKYRLERIIYKSTSENFEIIVAKTRPLGKVLMFREDSDYTIQTAEKYDFYDETIAHAPMITHPNPKKILIIGGGDGVVAREVLKYDVDSITIVEIDQKVVEISRKYLKLDQGALSDKKVKIVFSDAAEFVKTASEKFDVIIGDYSDPYEDTPAGTLVGKEFYRNISRLLSDEGLAIFQAGSPLFQKEIFIKILKSVKSVFPIVKVLWTIVPYYPGGMWTFVMASKNNNLEKIYREPPQTTFYNVNIHKAAFALPKFLEELVKGAEL